MRNNVDLEVSIVIVCMNNLKNLYPCLKSIYKYTNKVTYETIVVAYLFSSENLTKVRSDFPWVKFVPSDEIRGFSENNNLALRQVKGRYTFVVNDDTEMTMPVIDKLVETIENLPKEVAIISPRIYLDRFNYGFSGKTECNFKTFLLSSFGLGKYIERKSAYINKQGVFRTFNISGAAFLIKTNVFSKLGYFDERYFFCPEDVALSTLLNKSGYLCYVNDSIMIHHYCGGTWSRIITATKPAAEKGKYIFYCENNRLKQVIFVIVSSLLFISKIAYWYTFGRKNERSDTMIQANINSIRALFSTQTPKELFVKYYTKK